MQSSGAISLTTPEEIDYGRVVTLKYALKLWTHGIKPNRFSRLVDLLNLAERYTGKVYKRTAIATAIADLDIVIQQKLDARSNQNRNAAGN